MKVPGTRLLMSPVTMAPGMLTSTVSQVSCSTVHTLLPKDLSSASNWQNADG